VSALGTSEYSISVIPRICSAHGVEVPSSFRPAAIFGQEPPAARPAVIYSTTSAVTDFGRPSRTPSALFLASLPRPHRDQLKRWKPERRLLTLRRNQTEHQRGLFRSVEGTLTAPSSILTMSGSTRDSLHVFISHASEDKNRFALPLAELLLANGISAWIDLWELRGGDSLPEMILNQGVGHSDVVIIGLSKISVEKPWVREEMDVATVARINGQCRIIPVTLDDDVSVPPALSHLLRRSSTGSGGMAVLADLLIRDIYGATSKPALGPTPTYAIHRTRRPNLTDPTDDIVFGAVIDLLRQHDGLNWVLILDDFQRQLAAHGISEDAYVESMHLLIQRGYVHATTDYSERRFFMSGSPVPSRRWLDEEERAGVDTAALLDRALIAVANDESLDPVFDGVASRTAHAILEQLQADGYIRYLGVDGMGNRFSPNLTPSGARRARQLGPR